MLLASSFPLLDIFFTMLEFFLFFVWIFLIISIFMDIFRSHDMGGFAKAIWVLFIIILPLLGALIYLLARGGGMHERTIRQAEAQQKAFDEYVRQAAAGSSSTVEQLAKLAELKQNGAISEEEFNSQKAKILA